MWKTNSINGKCDQRNQGDQEEKRRKSRGQARGMPPDRAEKKRTVNGAAVDESVE